MITRTILGTIIICLSAGWASSCIAEGALAVGMPEGNPSKGFRWSVWINDADAASKAMRDCRAARNPRTGAACVLIGSFSDQCVAVMANGESNKPVTAGGWAIAPDSETAIKRALAQCDGMRKGQGKSCELDGGRDNALRCDGNAK